jgi:hypothetical protein
MSAKQETFPSNWAVVELMGHVQYVGEFEEVSLLGSTMGRVNALKSDGSRELVYFAAGSVYRIKPVTEEQGRKLMRPYCIETPDLLDDAFNSNDNGAVGQASEPETSGERTDAGGSPDYDPFDGY